MYRCIFKGKSILIMEHSLESAHFLFTFLWDNNAAWYE